MEATAKDLRFHSKQLLDTVARGEEVVITYRCRPCAKLVPYAAKEFEHDAAADEPFGIWRDHEEATVVDEYVRELRSGRFS